MNAPEQHSAITLDLTPREVLVTHVLMGIGLSVLASDAKSCAELMQTLLSFGEEGATVCERAFDKIDALFSTLADEIKQMQGDATRKELLS